MFIDELITLRLVHDELRLRRRQINVVWWADSTTGPLSPTGGHQLTEDINQARQTLSSGIVDTLGWSIRQTLSPGIVESLGWISRQTLSSVIVDTLGRQSHKEW